MNKINDAINTLKGKRAIFHSEDDLKFAFAFELAKSFPNIRLEKPEEMIMETRDGKSKKIKASIDMKAKPYSMTHFCILFLTVIILIARNAISTLVYLLKAVFLF